MRRIRSIDDLEDELRTRRLYVRYSEGPEHDRQETSIDVESGLELPGLSANPLNPESWWTRPAGDWIARQLCQYEHLGRRNPDRRAWLVAGDVTARGPDCEPLLVDVDWLAVLDETLLQEARRRYHERFAAGEGPEGSEGHADEESASA